jgi:hypothetical protein
VLIFSSVQQIKSLVSGISSRTWRSTFRDSAVVSYSPKRLTTRSTFQNWHLIHIAAKSQKLLKPLCGYKNVHIRVWNFYGWFMISGFHRDVDEICVLLGCYAASSGNPLPKFRDNVSVPSSRVKKSGEVVLLHWISWPLKIGLIHCPETSVKDYHSTLHNTAEERRSLWLIL